MHNQDHQNALVSAIKSRSTIKDPSSEAFAKTGTAAARVLAATFARHGVRLDAGSRVLDFGAGSGRVAIPLLQQHPDIELSCVDVDEEAIAYLAAQLAARHRALVNRFQPPLPFEDAQFDVVYSISVWSHLPKEPAAAWLLEIRRLLRETGIAVITTAGFGVLEHWRQTAVQWRNVDASVLERDRFVYREYMDLKTKPVFYPGISGEGSWGNTLIHPDYVREEWSRFLNVVEIVPSGMNGLQDIVVLRR